jgi:hypothetical protein
MIESNMQRYVQKHDMLSRLYHHAAAWWSWSTPYLLSSQVSALLTNPLRVCLCPVRCWQPASCCCSGYPSRDDG